MKLRDLFLTGEIPSHPEYEVDDALALHSDMVHARSLRFWDGRDRAAYESAPRGGVMVVPYGCDLRPGSAHDVTVLCVDPKLSFFRALRVLYPEMERPVMRVMPRNNLILESTLENCPGALDHSGHNIVIGGIGFGIVNGERIPHIGSVHIGTGVHIGSSVCIDRGTLGNTSIGAHTHIDNLVHIAHNAVIGQRCTIVAGAVIGGSVRLGDRVFVGMNASIKNKVTVGDGATIGMGAVVLHDVPAGATVVGNPARILPPKE